ncbi:MAG: hypothetical protein LBK56_00880 [Gracilibacteraceae bacterium]|jgi:hypothetical protein|nr:hypothetical protein [Gracilibacteraceae bacterium]
MSEWYGILPEHSQSGNMEQDGICYPLSETARAFWSKGLEATESDGFQKPAKPPVSVVQSATAQISGLEGRVFYVMYGTSFKKWLANMVFSVTYNTEGRPLDGETAL